MASVSPGAALFPDSEEKFTIARLYWLIQLRWAALAYILLAAALAAAGAFPGVAWQVLLATVFGGTVYNLLLWRSHRDSSAPHGKSAAMTQAVVDMAILTVVLWAAGGVASPFVVYYVFHVVLVGILGGPRATVLAAAAALAGAGLLLLTHVWPVLRIGVWEPVPPWDWIASMVAYTTTVFAVAYLVTHAVRELRDRERALSQARDRAALEYQLLSKSLDELDAGLEVTDTDGRVLFRNKRAEELAPPVALGDRWRCPGESRPCERQATGVCPVQGALENGEPGRCRFAFETSRGERVYEMMVFPLSGTDGQPQRVMNLYVDRTHAMLAERRLVLAERLASLGRVAQGVAHELNTPLATVRTLAADMRVALRDLKKLIGDETDTAVVADLDESAELIQDETRRLGRITQALLAGGDLVCTRVHGAVPLAAVIERARALVFAGVREGPSVEVEAGIRGLTVATDPDRLVQVLVNLLQNAYDAVRSSGNGHVVVRAHRTQAHVELTVEDDGPGIDERIVARLFEPFATTKPPGQGTGLGLYTSYMLVRAMGGTLTLERKKPRGTLATVRLIDEENAVEGTSLSDTRSETNARVDVAN